MMKNAELLRSQVAKNLGIFPRDIEFMKSLKNNGVEKTVVCLNGFAGKNVSPMLYIDDIINRWKPDNPENIPTIAEIITRQAEQIRSGRSYLPRLDVDRDLILSHCQLQVVGAEKNERRLAMVPHHRFADLAAIIRVSIYSDGSGGSSSVLVTNEMLKSFELDADELFEVAKRNTVATSHFECLALDEVMANLSFGKETIPITHFEPGLYCLTNRTKMNGAAILAIPDLLAEILKDAPKSTYIIPSSIHEVLIFVGNGMDVSALKTMVTEVNATEVPPEDVLSDSVYVFDHDLKQLQIVL